MSGNGVRVTNRVLFCKKVVVCDMLLSNSDIIYRLRKFSTRVRLEGQVGELDGKVSYEGQMGGLGGKVSYEGQVGGLGGRVRLEALAILEYRDKPIFSLLEEIRFYISSKIVKLRTMMMRYEGTICPKIIHYLL